MSTPVTICFTYFKSLALANLKAALYSVRQQDMTFVDSIVIVDNDTEDDLLSLQSAIEELSFVEPVRLLSFKHGDLNKTHSWSTNTAVREVTTPWVFFTRADYILDFCALEKMIAVVSTRPSVWNGFVTSNGCHLNYDVGMCEQTNWRETGPKFAGQIFDYSVIDSGVWLARKEAFDEIGGLDERLTAWGHAQTDFQHRMHLAGVEFVCVPEVLFYHPLHSGERDIALAHSQLAEKGADLKTMWARHKGEKVYG